jgi:hypothetical protein
MPCTIPFHATTELPGTITSHSGGTRVNLVSIRLMAIKHEHIAVFFYIIAGDTPPGVVTERWTGVVAPQCGSVTNTFRISGFGCRSFHGVLQGRESCGRESIVACHPALD